MFDAAIHALTHQNYPAYGDGLSKAPRPSAVPALLLGATASTASSARATLAWQKLLDGSMDARAWMSLRLTRIIPLNLASS